MSSDHSWLAYDEPAQCRAVTVEFLAEGLKRGQRVGYFGWGDDVHLRASLSGLDEHADGSDRGAVMVMSLDDLYRRDVVPPSEQRLAFWSQATDESMTAGYGALRVVTETTPWLRLPDQRAEFLRSEVLLDRYMLDHPLTVLCVCDRTRLETEALEDVVCIHPSSMSAAPAFRLHGAPGASFAVEGEIDALSAPVLERLLANVDDTARDHDLVIDAESLEFVNHHGLLALERHAARAHLRAVVVRRAAATVGRLVGLLELQRVRIESPR